MVSRRTSLLDARAGPLEFLTTGSGLPATVFAHGLSGSIATTRPFGSGVNGSRTFLHFRGLGSPAAQQPLATYAVLADQLRAVADHVGATQALGVSMGAGALCSLLAQTPLRFERLVFVMPAVLDRPRTDDAMARLVEEAVRAEHGDARGLADPPLTDRAALAPVAVPALVIAQEADPAHPVWVAEQLARSLPDAHLEVMSPGGLMERHRAVMRELIGEFLSREALPIGQTRTEPLDPED